MFGDSNQLFLILLVLIIPLGIFMYYRNKKKKQQEGTLLGNRKTRKDEVWNIVKKYLKENNESGKEIVELFHAKQRDPDDTSWMNKQEKKDFKQRKKEFRKLKKTNPEEYYKLKAEKKQKAKNKPPEIFFLYFRTWNSKTKIMDEPRILEVEVKYIKVDKKNTNRKIFVKGLADFNKEMEWIAPLKEKEDKIIEKQRRINESKKRRVLEQQRKKKEKMKEKEKAKKAQQK